MVLILRLTSNLRTAIIAAAAIAVVASGRRRSSFRSAASLRNQGEPVALRRDVFRNARNATIRRRVGIAKIGETSVRLA
jgi:hypothetical protein